MRRLVIVLVTVALLAGCSTVRVGYNQLDWIIPLWFQSYVPLDEDQKIRLRIHARELIAWHCETQLPRYAVWLRQVNDDFQTGINADQLETHLQGMERAWIELADQIIPRVVNIFSTLTDEQVNEILQKMEKDNTEYQQDYMKLTADELRNDIADQVDQSFRRWFGRLTDTQKRTIKSWSHKIKLMNDERWSNRMRWQQEFRELLRHRRDTKRLAAGFRRLVIDWDRNHSAAYQSDYETNNKLTVELVVDVAHMMTDSQKQRMAKKTARYAADFDYLACNAKAKVAIVTLYNEWRFAQQLQIMLL